MARTPAGWPVFDGLTPVGDVSPADWLLERLLPFGDPRVGQLVPRGYEAYARVLPPVWTSSEGVADSHRWSDIARTRGIPLDSTTTFNQLVGWNIYTDGNNPPAPYQQPPHGDMDDADCQALAEILQAFTTTPDSCWFAFWEGYGWASLPAPGEGPPRWHAPNRDYLLFTGSVAAATSFRDGPWTHAPTIWWPKDRAWCVATDIDGYRTYVAASSDAIEALIADTRLEIMPVSYDDEADTSPYHLRH